MGHCFPFLIILMYLCSCCISTFQQHLSAVDHFIHNEYNVAYPSYLSPIEGIKFYNSSSMHENGSYLSPLKEGKTLPKSDGTIIISVLKFGAKADGKTDDSKAFQKAWKEACSSSLGATLTVPNRSNGSYLLKPIRFSGPCKSNITVQISGSILASDDPSDYKKDGRRWIVFDRVDNMMVEGGGIIDGNGNSWWKNSCKIDQNKPCKDAPTALRFNKCKKLKVKNLRIKDAQQMHLSFQRCTNVEANNLIVNAPQNSPNTDGIHITATLNIKISNTTIGTGDDCISIVNGSQNVQVTNITCGPGHGISIGSLGSNNSEAHVSDVLVDGAKLTGTTNGVQIKTWQGGSGSASDIKFRNVEMENVKNPIIINQNYCDQDEPCKEQSSAVQIKDVAYQNITGTSASKVALIFQCSKALPCQGIVLQNVILVDDEDDSQNVIAVCNNVDVQYIGKVLPLCP